MAEKEPATADTLAELSHVSEMYPYFQAVRFLYIRQLKLSGSAQYSDCLSQSAIYSSDRRLLFFFLEKSCKSPVSDIQKGCGPVNSGEAERQLSLIDTFLSGYQQVAKETDLTFVPPVDVLSELGDLPDATPKDRVASAQDDLIDRFIKNGEGRIRLPELEVADDKAGFVPATEIPAGEGRIEPDEKSLSENQAKIFIKQKKYGEALEIIKKLSLKYPEKNIYFADQIRFLRKLIINNIKS